MDKDTAQQLIKETFQNPFDKERFVYFIQNLLNLEHKQIESKHPYSGKYIPDAYKSHISTLERIAKYTDGENEIDVLVVKLKKEFSLQHARTMQRNFIAWYLNGSRGGKLKDAALVAFVSPNNEDWRFSLVKMEYKFNKTKADHLRAKEELTPARRYSFLVGIRESSHTAQSRLVSILGDDVNNPTLKQIEEAFNIERVTKEFFEKYRELFYQLCEALDRIIVDDLKIKKEFKVKNINAVDFAKKLLGQIVFLYFLQKKGWFGVKRNKNWGTGPKDFLRLLFKKEIVKYNNFFNDILEPLFYEALRNDRSYDDHYFSYFKCKIPFLNGGLFDPINDYNWSKIDIFLPNEVFSNNEKTKGGDIGTGILDIFDRYNFTVKEDEPLEKEVAIDPEMLGKVFENLLEVKDRKSKGTYYTPREIVHYMSQQSLINYLVTELKGKVEKEDIKIFVKHGETFVENEFMAIEKQNNIQNGEQKSTSIKSKLPQSIIENILLIDEQLRSIYVCDPAVGSGAFLVGMMNEIIRARNSLTPYLKGKKDRMMYDFKRHAIQNCLYGVDIDSGAVEIAKLRLWLSLIVDEEDIEQIKHLPNLDYKIMQGNSLIELLSSEFFNKANDNRRNELIDKFDQAKKEFFDITSASKKTEKRNEIDKLLKELFEYDRNLVIDNLKEEIQSVKNQGRLFKDRKLEAEDKKKIRDIENKINEYSKLKNLGPSDHFEWHLSFSEVFQEKGGFDVVIANPPWVSNDNIDEKDKEIFKKNYIVAKSRFDLANLFVERALNLLKKEGWMFFVTPEHIWIGDYFIPFRKYLSKNSKIFEIISSKETSFEQVANPSSIFLAQNSRSKRDDDQVIELGTFYSGDSPLKFKTDCDIEHRIIFNEFIQKLNKKIHNCNFTTIAEIALATDGIQTADLLKIIFTQEPKDKNKYFKALRSGKDIKFRYAPLKWSGWWVLKPEYTKTFKRPGFSYDSPKRMLCFAAKEKILLRQTEPTIFATLDTNRYYFPNSIFQVALEKEDPKKLRWILGLLNSKFLRYFYGKLAQVEGTTKPQIYLNLLKSIPIPNEIELVISDLVSKILVTTKDDNYLENLTNQVKVCKYEKQIDQRVYKLYGLTPEEIKIIEK